MGRSTHESDTFYHCLYFSIYLIQNMPRIESSTTIISAMNVQLVRDQCFFFTSSEVMDDCIYTFLLKNYIYLPYISIVFSRVPCVWFVNKNKMFSFLKIMSVNV